MIRLSAFADEISQNPIEQLDVLSGHGIKAIEFRAIHGTNVLDLSETQHAEFRDRPARHFDSIAIGSPIGKIPDNRVVRRASGPVERALDLADFYQAPRIRIFSFTFRRATIRHRIARTSEPDGRARTPCREPQHHPFS